MVDELIEDIKRFRVWMNEERCQGFALGYLFAVFGILVIIEVFRL